MLLGSNNPAGVVRLCDVNKVFKKRSVALDESYGLSMPESLQPELGNRHVDVR